MSVNQEITEVIREAHRAYRLIQELSKDPLPPSNNDYINVNQAYFRICTDFYSNLMDLIANEKPFPAIVILRSFLEIYIKSFYIEFVEKPKGTNISALISGKKNFPNFTEMASDLDKFGSENENGFKDVFVQFTKKGLRSYEKFSLFTHGRGEYVSAFMKRNQVLLSLEDVRDLLITAKGMYETLALLYFAVHSMPLQGKMLLNEIVKHGR